MSSFWKNFGLFLTGLVASFLVISPTYRARFSNFISEKESSRHILATLAFTAGPNLFKAVKIRKDKQIVVEIYKMTTENYVLVTSFNIPGSRDLFYDFESSMSNLFSANIDADAGDEVIVPVLDQNLVARLNVIKFDPATKSFEHYDF